MEIERKFLIKLGDIPFHWISNCYYKIDQTYIAISNDLEIRVRRLNEVESHKVIDTKYFLTVKSNTTNKLVRNEFEISIDEVCYDQLIKDRPILKKERYDISKYINKKAVLDKYLNLSSSLYIVEVEFDSIEEANLFEPCHFLGPEITNVDMYKNRNLWKRVKEDNHGETERN